MLSSLTYAWVIHASYHWIVNLGLCHLTTRMAVCCAILKVKIVHLSLTCLRWVHVWQTWLKASISPDITTVQTVMFARFRQWGWSSSIQWELYNTFYMVFSYQASKSCLIAICWAIGNRCDLDSFSFCQNNMLRNVTYFSQVFGQICADKFCVLLLSSPEKQSS